MTTSNGERVKKTSGDSGVTIPGNAIASSIEMMSALGPIGERVLKEQGIDEIDPDKRYSHTIRTAMFEEVANRFGNNALTAFGFENYSHYPEFVSFIEQFRRTNQNGLKTISNYEQNIQLVGEMMTDLGKMLHAVVSRYFRSNAITGYVKIYKTSPALYKIETRTVLNLDHWPFIKGAWLPILMGCVSDVFAVDFDFDETQSKPLDGGWVIYVFQVRFTPHEELQNGTELVAKLRFEANESLLRNVLLDAERQKQKLQTLSVQLGKYLPPQIHQALFLGDYDTNITTRRKKLTIFFSDIKNFTSTSEGMQPEDLTKYLNEYFSEMTEIALSHGATIDKYIGDAMMVFFGDPKTKGEREDARSCVAMALAMRERLLSLQKKWLDEGFADPFQIRMGMNTGYCNVGNFGSDQRLTYTIIGGEVNVAQRLESAAEAGGILMSYETYAHSQDMISAEEVNSISMKGIKREIKVYSVRASKLQDKLKNNKDHDPESKNLSDDFEQKMLARLATLEEELRSFKREILNKT